MEAKNLLKNEEIDSYIVIRKLDTQSNTTPTATDSESFKTASTRKTAGTKSMSIGGLSSVAREKDVVARTKIVWHSKAPWFDESFEVELDENFSELSSMFIMN